MSELERSPLARGRRLATAASSAGLVVGSRSGGGDRGEEGVKRDAELSLPATEARKMVLVSVRDYVFGRVGPGPGLGPGPVDFRGGGPET